MSAEAYYRSQQRELEQVLIRDLAKLTMTYIKETVEIPRVYLQLSETEVGLVHVRHKDDRFVARPHIIGSHMYRLQSICSDRCLILESDGTNFGYPKRSVHLSRNEFASIDQMLLRVQVYSVTVWWHDRESRRTLGVVTL